MLTNNFKLLIPFQDYDELLFKNVKGEDTSYTNVLVYNTYYQRNRHNNIYPPTSTYNTNTSFNSFTDEQSTYNWNSCAYTIFVGSGLTTPTIDDYKLDNALTLDTLNQAVLRSNNIMSIIRTFINTTDEAVTINEVGLYVVKSNNLPVLIGRKVLEAPVVLNPNETFTFTYQITMEDFTSTEG